MNSMNRKEFVGSALLLLTAFIWGTAFVAQKDGVEYIGPCSFNAIRSFIGCLALIPGIALIDKLQGKRLSILGECTGNGLRILLAGGISCGLILGIASICQQIGIKYTTVGKSGFITTLYIFVVPIIGLFFGRRFNFIMCLCIFAASFGLYLLCFKGEGGVNKGDIMVFLCSIAFAFHIIVVDYFAPKTDCVRMSCIQFFMAGIVSTIFMLFFERLSMHNVMSAYVPLLYAGVMSSGVAYTLQVVAQKNVHPVVASLLMSLESVFAALGGRIIMKESFSSRQLAGCIIIFTAVIVAQIPWNVKKHD